MAFTWLISGTYTFQTTDDLFYGSGIKQSFNGGEGRDTVSYENSISGVFVNLASGYGKGGFASGDYFVSIENITGSEFNDGFIGTDDDNVFKGLGGNDSFYGSKGNDNFVGGAGVDRVNYSSSDKAIRVNVASGEVSKGADGTDSVSGVEIFYGSNYNDFFFGDEGANVFYGNGGGDYFYSDAGADYYYGGTGTDSINYYASRGGVSVDLTSGLGQGNDAEGDQYSGIEEVFGSGFDDRVIGSAENNYLSGNKGSDVLMGEAGDDFIVGGRGIDRLEGGSGADLLWGDEGDDELYGGDDNDILFGGEGEDYINGGAGIDTVNYGIGVFGDNSSGAIVRLDQGYADDNWGGRDTLVFVENVAGSQGDDRIFGDDGENHIEGNGGDDLINGGGGNDVLSGGAGLDIFVFANNDGFGDDFFHGQDLISDFEIGVDKIDLSATEVNNFNDLFSPGDRYMEQVGSDTVVYTINGVDGDMITLQGVSMSELSVSDFIF